MMYTVAVAGGAGGLAWTHRRTTLWRHSADIAGNQSRHWSGSFRLGRRSAVSHHQVTHAPLRYFYDMRLRSCCLACVM